MDWQDDRYCDVNFKNCSEGKGGGRRGTVNLKIINTESERLKGTLFYEDVQTHGMKTVQTHGMKTVQTHAQISEKKKSFSSVKKPSTDENTPDRSLLNACRGRKEKQRSRLFGDKPPAVV